MRYYSNLFYILLTFFVSININARFNPIETSRLKSTAGSGVGSILLEESAFLNPASASFFNASSIYALKTTGETSDKNQAQYGDNKELGFILADSNPSLSGTLSYFKSKNYFGDQKFLGVSMAGTVDQASALGFSVKKISQTELGQTNEYYLTNIGVTHVVDEYTSMGVLIEDAFKSKAKSTRAYFGIQKALFDSISSNLDLGVNYTSKEISKTFIYKASLQVRVLNDFFLRAGIFKDNEFDESGSGFGLAWVQPKLAFEFGIKSTNQTNKDYKETSFSISLRGF